MNLKRTLLLCIVFITSHSFAQAAPETYQIDPVHSTIEFKIRHLGISWVTGSFAEFSGTTVFDEEKPESSSVSVTVKATSVDTRNTKRDTHLRSADFFNIEKFPELTFKSNKVEKLTNNEFKVTGDFTLHGVTKPLVFTLTGTALVDGMQGEKRRGGETTFTIKRSDFGMSSSLGPVGDDVQITLAFSGIKQ
ncbi:MAG: YceI family protein [Blastochloris sp.]|jgi:polyisoprenoid-binding protein YceI|nr:YceI family protein [Blastochloris sp.]